MAHETPPAVGRPRSSVLGVAAQVVGAAGFLVGLSLAALVLLARGRAIDRVDEIAERVDDALAKGGPLLARARERADRAAEGLPSLGEAVLARAADGAARERVEAVLERATELSDRYLALRSTYADARERVVAAAERLGSVDAMVPGVSIPDGPREALASLDERVRALDANVLELIEALRGAGSGAVGEAVAEKVEKTTEALRAVSARLVDAGSRLDGLRGEVATRFARVRTAVTAVSVVLVLACLYVALLHAVLFRSGRRPRRESARGD